MIAIRTAIVLGIICFMAAGTGAEAQTAVTFQVDLTHLLDGKEFDAERDKVELIGNRHPLSSTRPLVMVRDEENPNLFALTVDFPPGTAKTSVEYQFRVMLEYRYHNEDIPRTLRVPEQDETLDSLYFNSYAW